MDISEQITKDLYAKVRMGIESADQMSYGANAGKDMNSYREYRFELNYLF